jgi:hypothetical protein
VCEVAVLLADEVALVEQTDVDRRLPIEQERARWCRADRERIGPALEPAY